MAVATTEGPQHVRHEEALGQGQPQHRRLGVSAVHHMDQLDELKNLEGGEKEKKIKSETKMAASVLKTITERVRG